jgi:hypothetical protein
MARIRTIKPELASHEELFDLERSTGLPIRFAWCMLFTVCDREGRFRWRPRTLKAQILPHDDLDFSRVLDAWRTRGFVRKYRVKGEVFGWVPTFTKHQVINNRESQSDIPLFSKELEVLQGDDACGTDECTRGSGVDDGSATREVHAQGEGRKEREGEGRNTEERVNHACLTREEPRDPAQATTTRGSESEAKANWDRVRAAYPAGIYGEENWLLAEHHARNLVDSGRATWDELAAAAAAFCRQAQACGRVGTQYITSPEKFFTGDKWQGTFPLPAVAKKPYIPAPTTEELEAREREREANRAAQ